MTIAKWDGRFLDLAKHVASWSRDPSTQCGAVIVDDDNRIISVGYNGFAKGVADYNERYNDRDVKYKIVLHAEKNAVLFAKRDLTGCTIYTWPFGSCSQCAAMIIQAGIRRVVSPKLSPALASRWGDSLTWSEAMFLEAGVRWDILE